MIRVNIEIDLIRVGKGHPAYLFDWIFERASEDQLQDCTRVPKVLNINTRRGPKDKSGQYNELPKKPQWALDFGAKIAIAHCRDACTGICCTGGPFGAFLYTVLPNVNGVFCKYKDCFLLIFSQFCTLYAFVVSKMARNGPRPGRKPSFCTSLDKVSILPRPKLTSPFSDDTFSSQLPVVPHEEFVWPYIVPIAISNSLPLVRRLLLAFE